ESIIARNIVDIRHQPGKENPVEDGLSRKWKGRERQGDKGDAWSVLPGWEMRKGISNDIQTVSEENGHTKLKTHFAGDEWLSTIIESLMTQQRTRDDRKKAHQTEEFIIKEGKLWRINLKPRDRSAKVECIPRAEGPQLAICTHVENGHFARKLMKLKLRDKYFWPKMDEDTRRAV
ncbi:hypothetical protein JB92DRAFT_2611288, partial [Gautieria morchelliformis]